MNEKIRLLVDIPVGKEFEMTAGKVIEARRIKQARRGGVRWEYDHPSGQVIGILGREAETVEEEKSE